MYLVVAVFNRYDLTNILDKLSEHKIVGITVTDVFVQGSFGLRELDDKPTDFIAKIKLEVVVPDEKVRKLAIECILANCNKLSRGTEKICWLEVGNVECI